MTVLIKISGLLKLTSGKAFVFLFWESPGPGGLVNHGKDSLQVLVHMSSANQNSALAFSVFGCLVMSWKNNLVSHQGVRQVQPLKAL